MKTERIYTSDNSIEAHLIKGRLLNEGIESILANEISADLLPLFNNMLGSGIQILVNEADSEKAKEIIKDKTEPEKKVLTCPYCGSTKIKYGLGERKTLKILNIILAVISFFPIGNLKAKYYCKNCKREIY